MNMIYISTHINKSEWADGPWKREPDTLIWIDEWTSSPCAIIRSREIGTFRCAVGLSEWHPLSGVHDMADWRLDKVASRVDQLTKDVYDSKRSSLTSLIVDREGPAVSWWAMHEPKSDEETLPALWDGNPLSRAGGCFYRNMKYSMDRASEVAKRLQELEYSCSLFRKIEHLEEQNNELETENETIRNTLESLLFFGTDDEGAYQHAQQVLGLIPKEQT